MQEYKIIEYGNLDDVQKEQAVEIFLEGFGHMMTFSKDRNTLKKLFFGIMNPSFFRCYVEQGQVLGIIGLATNKVRPLKFDCDVCIELFGKMKGKILSKQMNAIFQAPVVKGDRDLYVDVLATSEKARNKGVATTLLEHAFDLKEFDCCYIEVFSKNERARRLYDKMGFSIYKKKKMALLHLAVSGAGYPIKMKRWCDSTCLCQGRIDGQCRRNT